MYLQINFSLAMKSTKNQERIFVPLSMLKNVIQNFEENVNQQLIADFRGSV